MLHWPSAGPVSRWSSQHPSVPVWQHRTQDGGPPQPGWREKIARCLVTTQLIYVGRRIDLPSQLARVTTLPASPSTSSGLLPYQCLLTSVMYFDVFVLFVKGRQLNFMFLFKKKFFVDFGPTVRCASSCYLYCNIFSKKAETEQVSKSVKTELFLF